MFQKISFTLLSGVFMLILGLAVFSFGEVKGQIALRAFSTSINNDNALTIAKPTGLAVDDLIIASILQSNDENDTLSNATSSG